MPSSTTLSEPARVLLVDDNEAMLTRAAAALKYCCLVVGSVKDSRKALEAALTLKPDVIVLDISMPGMSGLEVASRLRDAGSNAALVFLTVHDEEDIILAAKAAGAIGYVVKPRLGSDLTLAVQEARAGRPFVSPLR
jgi:DNA-binding NarL/FixJ family response regulator